MAAGDVNVREMIARIDERTSALLTSHSDLRDEIKGHVDNIYADVDKHYTKKADFDPVRKLVFGFVGFMLISIGGMFIGLIVKTNSHAEPPSIQKQFQQTTK